MKSPCSASWWVRTSTTVTRGMGYDSRIGEQIFAGGYRVRRQLFSKGHQSAALARQFPRNEIKTIKAAIEVNENQKLKPIKIARKYFDSLEGLTIAVLGLTFKPGTDDLREAPSLVNIPIMLDDGAHVKAWDPVGMENFKKRALGDITYCDSIESTLDGADVCFIFTEWPEIKNLDVSLFSKEMRQAIIIDGRNCYALARMEQEPVIYHSIGRRTIFNLNRG